MKVNSQPSHTGTPTFNSQQLPLAASNQASLIIKMIVVGLLLFLSGVACGYYLSLKDAQPTINPGPRAGQTIFPPADEGVTCTMEAKECPDGSYVGRSGPNCEFEACPTAN